MRRLFDKKTFRRKKVFIACNSHMAKAFEYFIIHTNAKERRKEKDKDKKRERE